jgi:hypothetical protein
LFRNKNKCRFHLKYFTYNNKKNELINQEINRISTPTLEIRYPLNVFPWAVAVRPPTAGKNGDVGELNDIRISADIRVAGLTKLNTGHQTRSRRLHSANCFAFYTARHFLLQKAGRKSWRPQPTRNLHFLIQWQDVPNLYSLHHRRTPGALIDTELLLIHTQRNLIFLHLTLATHLTSFA